MGGSKMSYRQMERSYMNNIIYIKNQNIFSVAESAIKTSKIETNIVIPHVCNNINAFGAGFAQALTNYDPSVKANFHMLGNKAKLGYTQFVTTKINNKNQSKIIIANMIAQNKLIDRNKNPRPINYMALVSCMVKVRDYINQIKNESDIKSQIYAPKFGSGLAGGNWNFIEYLIEDIWTDIPVFIYEKNENKHLVSYK
jgi:hypothetical protein